MTAVVMRSTLTLTAGDPILCDYFSYKSRQLFDVATPTERNLAFFDWIGVLAAGGNIPVRGASLHLHFPQLNYFWRLCPTRVVHEISEVDISFRRWKGSSGHRR